MESKQKYKNALWSMKFWEPGKTRFYPTKTSPIWKAKNKRSLFSFMSNNMNYIEED